MKIRKANALDSAALKDLYFNHLTKTPPEEPQNMDKWKHMLKRFENDDNYHILIAEVDGMAVSSITLVIIDNLTYNLRSYAIIQNVVTHADFRCKGYASALLERANVIAKELNCYKIMLLTGSMKESTHNFYRNNGFSSTEKTGFIKRL